MKIKLETNFFCKSYHWPRRMSKIKDTVKKICSFNDLEFKKKNKYILNLVFTNDKKIKKLNKIYKNKNQATDVLTFVSKSNNFFINKTIYCDIFFSAETIKKDAKKNLIDFYDHLAHLIIHCFLHVNGYDHQSKNDFLKMSKLETKILLKLGIKNPYSV
tara:strand:- start:962 stop:1438 length:477 start_codon:yes stop_codon:yes gene_type:complete